MSKIWYPNSRRIILNNKLVLKKFPAAKGDRFKILGRKKIINILRGLRNLDGDIEDKAAFLFKNLAIDHPFEAGNKRTAYFSANQFISKNKGYYVMKKKEKQKEFVHKIKFGEVTDGQIADWFR